MPPCRQARVGTLGGLSHRRPARRVCSEPGASQGVIVTDSGLIVTVEGHHIRVKPCTLTIIVGRDVGDGCVNDEAADVLGYEAEFRGHVAYDRDAQVAAEAAYLLSQGKPRRA